MCRNCSQELERFFQDLFFLHNTSPFPHSSLPRIKKEVRKVVSLTDQSKARHLTWIKYPHLRHQEKQSGIEDPNFTQCSGSSSSFQSVEKMQLEGCQRMLRELSPGQWRQQQQQQLPTSLTPLSLYAIDSTFSQRKLPPQQPIDNLFKTEHVFQILPLFFVFQSFVKLGCIVLALLNL